MLFPGRSDPIGGAGSQSEGCDTGKFPAYKIYHKSHNYASKKLVFFIVI